MLKEFTTQLLNYDSQLVVGLNGSAKAFAIAQAYLKNPSKMVYVTANLLQATQLSDDLYTFLPQVPIHQFFVEESSVEQFALASKDLQTKRILALDFLLNDTDGIVITNLSGLKYRLAPSKLFQQHMLTLQLDDDYALIPLVEQLVEMGYTREKLVESPGQFSLRGGILDIFTLTHEDPIRIEFFDTTIDSMRLFDAQTQKSRKNIESIKILPATDMPFVKEAIAQALPKIEKALQSALKTIEDSEITNHLATFFNHLMARLQRDEIPEHFKLYSDFIYGETNLLDYLSIKGIVVIDDYIRLQEVEHNFSLEEANFQMKKVSESIVLPTQKLSLAMKDVLKQSVHKKVYFTALNKGLGRLQFSQIYTTQYRSMPQFFSQMPLIKTEIDRLMKQKMTVVVCVSDDKRAEKVSKTFEDFEIKNIISSHHTIQLHSTNIVVGSIHNGFELPVEKIVYLNERELFNKVTKVASSRRQNLTNAEKLKSYSELKSGDYIVHVNHGVGKYVGMETLEVAGVKQDYMSIIYENDAKLFIPVTQIHLIQKYVASDGRDPKVNKLGGSEWAKTKKKVAKKIEDIADELIELYAKREAQVGFAFEKDTIEQKQFEDAFPYAETADQLRSVVEIKKDMENKKPMDRLLVGDVGYGKTEVAMRAIFKAVSNGKQVAFLVPTTILAQQHFLTLSQRFEEFPFKVDVLSRFRNKKEQAETLVNLKQGKVDIIVGTHRLLSKDVDFSDLGLVVIDEEQRFGVKHKERLKQLRSQVDVLTLTATPIPRTLHMSMLGVRDLSVIETPPANRYPVQTYVIAQDYSVVKDGIEREIARGGQVFYLYNRVETIQEKADSIRQVVPDAKIAIAHGQMSEVQLESVLMDFMSGVYDVLVTTTIVETGVDLPNVNTLFIEDADRMGLSQLYQLRGRVGRTNRIAYAYFMYKPDKSLTEAGEKRLEAIKEFTQLGAGFKIAMRDLSIRGAGNLLGQQQSGFIDSVGFDLYTEMLKEAVLQKQTGVKKVEKVVEIDLNISAYIPSEYIEDERQKIDIYKRIRTIENIEQYQDIQDDLIDRFGDYPQEVADLVNIGLLKWYALEQDVIKIKRLDNIIEVTFNVEKSKQLQGAATFEMLSKTKLKASVKYYKECLVLVLVIDKLQPYQYIEQLQKLLQI